jgi:hypothetical protein
MPTYTAAQLKARLESWGYRVETEEALLRGNDRWAARASKWGGHHTFFGFTEVEALEKLVLARCPLDVAMGNLADPMPVVRIGPGTEAMQHRRSRSVHGRQCECPTCSSDGDERCLLGAPCGTCRTTRP